MMQRAEQAMPWVIYTYGRTHDEWWPFWNSTRILGRASIQMSCMVCGDVTVAWYKIPRIGPVPEPEGGKHPVRVKYLAEHVHLDRGHPLSWARPLENMNVYRDGLDLDLLAMRIEGDINDGE